MSLTEKEFKNILSRTEKNLEAAQRDLVLSNHNLDLVSVESYIYNNQTYKLNKEDITGYNYEPWHFRYVGNMASYIYYNNLVLEEL